MVVRNQQIPGHFYFHPFRVDTIRSQVYIRPASVSLPALALSGSIFPSLPADKLFPATHQEFTYTIA